VVDGRATAGEVTGGFTKDEIPQAGQERPRAEGGVFSRVSGLLRDLSEGVGYAKILKTMKKKLFAAAMLLAAVFVAPMRADVIEQCS
jgi:hypothetical protein